MTVKDAEQYIKVLRLSPDSKYLLVISTDSGLTPKDVQKLRLNDSFLDEIIFVRGNLDQVIRALPTTK